MTAPMGAPSPFEKSIQAEIPSHRHIVGGDAGRDAGIQQSSAVHVGGKAVRSCDLRDLVEIGFAPDRATADIGGLLDADHGLRRLIAGARVKRGPKSLGREFSIGSRQRGDLESAKRRVGAALARDDMC